MATRKTTKRPAPFVAPVLTCCGYAAASNDATAKDEYKRLLDAGKEDVAKAQLYTGYIMSYANAALDDGEAFEAATSQFELADKARNDSARKACVAARKAWSRLRGAFNHIVRHGNSGNTNARKGDKPAAGKIAPTKLPTVSNDKMTRAAYLALVIDTLAALESKGKACDDVESAAIKEIELLRAKMIARSKIEK